MRRGATRAIVLAMGLLALPAGAAARESANYQVDAARTGDAGDAGLSLPLQRAWTARFPLASDYAVIAGGRAFVADDGDRRQTPGRLVALDLTTGHVDWSEPLAIRLMPAELAVDDGKVFVTFDGEYPAGSDNEAGYVMAFDQATGRHLWTTTVDESSLNPPLVADGILYLVGAGIGHRAYALHEDDGSPAWASVVTEAGGDGVVAGDRFVVGGVCGDSDAFDRLDGDVLWADAEGCDGGGSPTESFDGTNVWSSDWTGHGRVYDPATGAVLWRFDGEAPVFSAGLALSAVANGHGAYIQAMNPANMVRRWYFDEPDSPTAKTGAHGSLPLVANGSVFLEGRLGDVWAFDPATGAIRWHDTIGDEAAGTGSMDFAGLAAGEGYLLVPGTGGLTAYRHAVASPPLPPATPYPPATGPPLIGPAVGGSPRHPRHRAVVRCMVPGLTGLSVRRARRRLHRHDCLLGDVVRPARHHVTRRRHGHLVVVRQRPKAGRHLRRWSRVRVRLARR